MSEGEDVPEQSPTAPAGGQGAAGGFDLRRLAPKRSIGLKLLLVCALALLMAIPTMFVWGVVAERSGAADRALNSVYEARGGVQEAMGPVIVVPYRRLVWETAPTGENGAMEERRRMQYGHYVVFAETGDVDADIKTELLKRGIHRAPVFEGALNYKASFDLKTAMKDVPEDVEFLWADTHIFMGLGDLRGAKEGAEVHLLGATYALSPARSASSDWSTGHNIGASAFNTYGMELISARLDGVNPEEIPQFSVDASMQITGAKQVSLLAFAKNTTASMTGDWASPSFGGDFLPTSRDLKDNGFTAEWTVPFLARGMVGEGPNIGFQPLVDNAIEVNFLDETSPYQSVIRALKYAPMFIGLVFLSYFLFEATSGLRAHPAQYVLVGLAKAVFYLLLLGVSEHAGFLPGFLAASVSTVSLLSLYAGAVFKSRSAAMKAFGIFSTLYALIFILMRMEDYALLVGSITSFLAIAFTMWMTRSLNWYGEDDTETKKLSG